MAPDNTILKPFFAPREITRKWIPPIVGACIKGGSENDCSEIATDHSSLGIVLGGDLSRYGLRLFSRSHLLLCVVPQMREEFASYGFLALTVLGVVLLGSGLVALAIT